MHRNLATALKNQGATFKSFRARCCLSFAKARRFACSTECHMVPLKCLNQESRLALTEQCQEGTDVNWDVFLWQTQFLLLLRGWGSERARGAHLSHSTLPAKCVCVTHFLCNSLKNLLLCKASPQPQS